MSKVAWLNTLTVVGASAVAAADHELVMQYPLVVAGLAIVITVINIGKKLLTARIAAKAAKSSVASV